MGSTRTDRDGADMSRRADEPCNASPLLSPETERVETRAVLNACIGARAAPAERRTLVAMDHTIGTKQLSFYCHPSPSNTNPPP